MPGLQPDCYIGRMQHGLIQAPVTQQREPILINWTASRRHCQTTLNSSNHHQMDFTTAALSALHETVGVYCNLTVPRTAFNMAWYKLLLLLLKMLLLLLLSLLLLLILH